MTACTWVPIVAISLLTPLQAGADGSAGLEWTAPSAWTKAAPRPMRAATYEVPGDEGADAGECAVFYFGRGQGGSVEANMARWLGQFQAPAGESALLPTRDTREINGLAVTTLDVSGTFLFKPFPAAPRAVPKPGYRMLAAIVEGPQGAVFFKLTAPEATANAAEADFEKMLESIAASD